MHMGEGNRRAMGIRSIGSSIGGVPVRLVGVVGVVEEEEEETYTHTRLQRVVVVVEEEGTSIEGVVLGV
jgi:hypothetical protein